MHICASMNYTEHSFNTLTLLGDQKRIDPVTANATYPQKLSPKLLFQNQHRKKIKGQPDNPGSSGCWKQVVDFGYNRPSETVPKSPIWQSSFTGALHGVS